MKTNRMAKIVLILIVVILAFLITKPLITTESSPIDNGKFSHLQIVSIGIGGMVGFFDPQDGRLWIYDLDKGECKGLYKLKELGTSLAVMK